MPRTLIILALVALTACGTRQDTADRDTGLRQLRNASGAPEEFSIVPVKPLQAPDSLTELPEPTPGGSNRTDQTPLKDAVAALGGSPSRLDLQQGIGRCLSLKMVQIGQCLDELLAVLVLRIIEKILY